MEELSRSADRSERRAEVVAQRAQDRRLHGVAPAQRLGLDRLPAEPLAVGRVGEERGERAEDALEDRRVRLRGRDQEDGSDAAATDR